MLRPSPAHLAYAIHQSDQVELRALDLATPGFRLIGPVVEVPLRPDAPYHAEALLVREAQRTWELRVARLGDDPLLRDPVAVDTPPPVWARVAHRPDGSRCAVFFVPRDRDDRREVEVLLAPWAEGAPPGPPRPVARWPGALLAADQRVDAGGVVVGVALLDVGLEVPQYALFHWRIDRDDRFEQCAFSRIAWPWSTPVERALLRTSTFGAPYAVLKGGPESAYVACRGEDVVPLPDALAPPAEPLDVYFLDQTVPTLVYADPRAGFSLYHTGPRRPRIAPTGLVA
jgi:hypothetical protein